MRFISLLRFIPIFILILCAHAVNAHIGNQVDHIITYKFSDAAKKLDVNFKIDFGFECATNMLYIYDADKNGQINDDEKSAIGNYVVGLWKEQFEAKVNETRIFPDSVEYEFSGGEIHFLSGGFAVTISASFRVKTESNRLNWELFDNVSVYSVGYYKYLVQVKNAIILGKPLTYGKKTNPWGLYFSLKGFDRDVGTSTFQWDEEEGVMLVSGSRKKTQTTEKNSDADVPGSDFNGMSDEQNDNTTKDERTSRNEKDEQFVELLKKNPLSIEGIIGLAMAFLLGMYHAMSPGHGKALVGSYLITSKGTFKDAIILALTVTVTHTGSVFLFGVVIMLTTANLTPSDFVPFLSLASGVLIVFIGFWIVITRSEHWKPHSHDHDHEHSHEHGHSHVHSHDFSLDSIHISDELALPIQDLSGEVYDVEDDEIEILEVTKHEHEQNVLKLLVETSAKAKPRKKKRSGVALKELLWLGITGGLVPCPTAIVVLLIAVALNKTVYGLMLIVSFSFGLAFVLGMLGVFMVITKKFVGKSGRFAKLAKFAPVISGIFITYVGWLIIFGGLHQLEIITFELNFLK
ncbi:MAG: hypothetical protein K8S87_09560 [Planctomycetes bacterium]|nr:hypothetical protein [Planctomycetota bacterium]